ncbi:hypothetical protein E2562_035532 [Oryza meyeriana var. granulata]|uniref:Uncharacterized protein n=1 Tax=Oryza meyeriana var. granulata TaxID=110450 RepID=A0A6G1E6W1_9ORYZ|nr:hypothetical protein E2562_035532 [Oryza meyeriana var. granulata]
MLSVHHPSLHSPLWTGSPVNLGTNIGPHPPAGARLSGLSRAPPGQLGCLVRADPSLLDSSEHVCLWLATGPHSTVAQ